MAKSRNTVRIIAGRWRGRQLGFPDVDGLRPTGDRIRETLFNWLQPQLGGARCLDAFAGSGVLGFEAASRGAASVTLLERDPQVVHALEESTGQLDADTIHIQKGDALRWQPANGERFDIVFIDPPFSAGLQKDFLLRLIELDCLSGQAVIYLESDRHKGIPELPSGWSMIREKNAGDVWYGLAQKT